MVAHLSLQVGSTALYLSIMIIWRMVAIALVAELVAPYAVYVRNL